MSIKLKMVRRGSFKANWYNTQNMCGVTESKNPTYHYVCEIECGTVLDAQGFMIDQLDVDRFFQVRFAASQRSPMGQMALSCERMAIACCEDVKYMVESHMMQSTGASEVHRIAVTISFNDTAAMTAEWKATDEQTCGSSGKKPSRKTPSRQRVSRASDSSEGAAAGRSKGPLAGESGGTGKSPRNPVCREPSGRYVFDADPDEWDGY
jgi:hypothetical protein